MNAKVGQHFRTGALYPGLLFLFGLVLSAVAAYLEHVAIDKNARDAFERMSVRTEAEIASRLEHALNALRGARGLFAASQRVDRDEFRRFILSRNLEVEFPGIRGFGFIQKVERTELPAFVAAERRDGAPEFAVRQLVNKSHADLFVIKFIEPAAHNTGAQGLDVGSEAIRRAGIQQAINTGAPTATGAITLVQDEKKSPGLLLYLPVYRNDAPIDIPRERRAALVGVLYAPIVMAEILQGIPDVQSGMLDFEIVDAPINTREGVLMFDADDHVRHLAPGVAPSAGRRYALKRPLQLPGRSVTLSMSSTSVFEHSINQTVPWLLFGGGLLISALLAAMLFQQASKRRHAEALAHDMTRDLYTAQRDSEALLSTLHLHAIVSIADRGGRIIEVNHAFCQISGYSRAELQGQDHRILKSGEHPPAFWVDMWKTISTGLPWRGQVCNRAKDGHLYWVDTLIAPFIGSDGQIEKYIAIRTDITGIKNAEVALTHATQAAQAASLSKSQFLANMSHEIRTPMNAILGMLALLRKTELSTRQADYAAKSESAARALLGLLNEILDFSKIEAGKMALDPHPFAIDQLLRDLSVILSANIGEKPVEVLFDVDPTLPRQLVGDAMRLQQILLNLGSNAIKFTPQGEVVLSIRALQRSDDAVTLQFSLRDSGIGIAPENQARIFSGFTQAEASTTRRFGGTGLGVAISQRFVSLMGGELELESTLGQGSRFFFTVTLPIAHDSGESDAQERQRMRTRAASDTWRTLVIDDNPTARTVLEHMGQSLGWQVDLAESGEQALQKLTQSATQGAPYQAIFVDWTLPDLDGWQTSQRIRALQAQHPGVARDALVVVMVTAQGRELLSQRSAAEQALLDGVLVKPITTSMLLDAVMDARSAHDQPHPARAAVQTAQRRLDGMRLLLVEDNLNNQQVACELLQDEGARVQIANHGQEAVEAVAAADPLFDVVLMDLQMPVMDGFAATQAIRKDLGLATLPIVAMTANAMASDREACLAVGMNDHVGKPFDVNDLVRVLRRQAQWSEPLGTPANADLSVSPDATHAARAAGVDLAAALQRLGGKQAVYRRMLQTFVRDLQTMPAHLQHDAPNDAKRVLHTLKGLAATLGATALSAQAASAEKALAIHPTPALLAATTGQACSAIAAALPGLQALLNTLRPNPATASTPGDAPPLDRPAFVATLQAMAPLLRAHDLEAISAMARVQQQFGEALGDELAALEESMAEMDFDTALVQCHALTEKFAG